MPILKPEIGSWYWITARGPARVTELPDGGKTTYTVELLSGITYWCGYDELHQLSIKTLDTYERELRARSLLNVEAADGMVACRDWILKRRP